MCVCVCVSRYLLWAWDNTLHMGRGGEEEEERRERDTNDDLSLSQEKSTYAAGILFLFPAFSRIICCQEMKVA